MSELEKFRKKASAYRKALAQQPQARSLELVPLVWFLNRYCRAVGKRKRSIKIVDLMSGTGYLSECLLDLGYTNLHAVEACSEMCDDVRIFEDRVRLHKFTSIGQIEGILAEIRPDVIISVASFHHLIEYDQTGAIIQKGESIRLQSNVVSSCMRVLADDGLMLILDLIEEAAIESVSEPFYVSSRSCLNDLLKLGVPKEPFQRLLLHCRSIHEISSQLFRAFGTTPNPRVSLRWFREVVDSNTSVGHKDVAISNELIESLGRFHPVVVHYYCPWLFSSRDALVGFIFDKFGFSVDCPEDQQAARKRIAIEQAERILGVREKDGVAALGWNLGVVALGNKPPFAHDRKLRTLAASLSLVVGTLCVAIVLRFVSDTYISLTAKDLLLPMLTFSLGVILGHYVSDTSGAPDR